MKKTSLGLLERLNQEVRLAREEEGVLHEIFQRLDKIEENTGDTCRAIEDIESAVGGLEGKIIEIEDAIEEVS